jgi:hypothetical protein
MGIQTKILADGTKFLLSRNGKSSVMQVIDSCGNVIKTRCKSISRTTTPVCTDAPTRTSIGFIPQQLRSHANDRTRLQIGFRLAGEKPKRFKTDIERYQYSTITKTDFNENFDIVNISNLQRQYSPNGAYIRTVPVGISKSSIVELQTQQSQLIKSTLERYNENVQGYQAKLEKLDKLIQEWNGTTAKKQELLELRKQLLARNKAEVEACLEAGIISELHKNYWFNEVAPVIEKSNFPEYAKMNPCVDAEQMLRERLAKLLKEEKQLNSLLKNEQREINERIQTIQPVLKQRDKFCGILDLMKSHCTKAEEEMRKMLCQIQRKITQHAANT